MRDVRCARRSEGGAGVRRQAVAFLLLSFLVACGGVCTASVFSSSWALGKGFRLVLDHLGSGPSGTCSSGTAGYSAEPL